MTISSALAGILDSLTPKRSDLHCWLRAQRHQWEATMCAPTICLKCRRRGYPLAGLHDVFDTGD